MKKTCLKVIFFNLIFLCIENSFAVASDTLIKSWLKKEEYIVLSEPVKIGKIDPISSNNAHSKLLLPLIFEPLITIDAEQNLHPCLAKSWFVSSDKKSILINLNPNHKFSDGTEVTSKDVINSFNRLCSQNSQTNGQLQGLIGCEAQIYKKNKLQAFAKSKYSLEVKINSSPTIFLYQLASPNVAINKQKSGHLIGSSFYLLYKKNYDYLILKKNPYYSGNVMVGNSGIVFFYYPTVDLERMLANDKPDGALMYQTVFLKNFNNANYKLIKTNSNITSVLVLNNGKFPFNQSEIREAIANDIYNNFDNSCVFGAHKAYGIIPSGVPGSLANQTPAASPEIPSSQIFSHFPVLEKSNVSIVIHQVAGLRSDCESNQIMNTLKKYKINVKFEYHKNYDDFIPLIKSHRLDAFIDSYIFKNREAYSILEFFTKNGENDANLKKNDLDLMLNKAKQSLSSHDRFQAYREAANYLQNEHVLAPLFYMDHVEVMSNCLTGLSDNFVFNPFSELPYISKIKNCQTNFK